MSELKNAILTKPSLSEAQVVELVGQLYRLKVSEVQLMPSFVDQNFHIQVAETQVSGDHRRSYVLKVLNTTDSQDVDLVEVQTRVMMFLKQKGFPTPTPIPTTDGRIMSLETINSGQEYDTHMVRLFTYLPGIPLQQIPADPPMLYKIGQTLAQINKILKEFQHPKLKSLQRDSFFWKVSNIHQLKEYLYVLKNSDRKVVEHIIQQILEKVLPNISNFHESINHGDFSHTNVLVHPHHSSADRSNPGHLQQELDISGILDFGRDPMDPRQQLEASSSAEHNPVGQMKPAEQEEKPAAVPDGLKNSVIVSPGTQLAHSELAENAFLKMEENHIQAQKEDSCI
ncbi:hydroxylysine kinase-like isoform X2 [Hemitrygon akajei]|uniref:hydroxylysine kinase-like isoform X2 n=1 Tax=Hemitrygon akajei TaxID=2704970 RepID=UPI003BFA2BEC